MIDRIDEDVKKQLIEQLNGFPTHIVSAAFVYATALNKFGVDVSKEWRTLTEQRCACDFAYRQGRLDEQRRWAADKEESGTMEEIKRYWAGVYFPAEEEQT